MALNFPIWCSGPEIYSGTVRAEAYKKKITPAVLKEILEIKEAGRLHQA